jgi:hypothetical protein
MVRVLAILRDEHRSIAAILHAMEYLLKEIQERASLDFQRLFTRIVNLAPPPIGVGPAARR